jgi:radical SAM superfamily enzyme YgiQ (UPF0313 family)
MSPDKFLMKRLKICLINPRFEPSYWGFDYALPLYPGNIKATMITGALPHLAGLIPNHDVCLIDENVEAIDFDSLRRFDIVGVTGMIVQKRRMLEILQKVRCAGVFTVVGGAYASVDQEFFNGYYDVLFCGEADETWPEFVDRFAAGKSVKRFYKQRQPTDMTKLPKPRFDLLKTDRYATGGGSVFARLPVPLRVLRHHRYLWPPTAIEASRASSRRTGRIGKTWLFSLFYR